ncbi:ribosomal protein S6 kinase-like 1 isoform X2 [Callorhinchus milii]|uniref:ribosomal protein S6 kinase-like 1 isoform X2 n=1 Tax=Callorhinchus milii TaxID=7868 RepID=UPI001C3FE2FC|nr:ribosomal protein S6 kinase-like 1 isoform X2 [Callorhinchus milii]XP_042194165.1 ribosomal protein S6 kinase-like 1 isoform X2 [Callorhinchus milii]XP_042194166.1 ribosomal protein S6 kinase-like 1 isoform X2 [Callorhinchus milii]
MIRKKRWTNRCLSERRRGTEWLGNATSAAATLDPNKERREAVKRKTTQYLKRAEEIFNSHLQENGADHTGGFSSLRFRPIRILSSPVENLKMSKVIAVIDKVLLVQNPSSNETFIVKSLSKCSLVNRERQTIIPQGVPFMVRLLQFYVSDDAVFLHLEHVAGGKLWSQLRHLRAPGLERVMEFPECSSPHHKTIKLKNSYTAPTLALLCNDHSALTAHTHSEQPGKPQNKDNLEHNTECGHTGAGTSDPESWIKPGQVEDQPAFLENGTDHCWDERGNKVNFWQGCNGISKALNGLKGRDEVTASQVVLTGPVTFDIAGLFSEKDAELTQSAETTNHKMAIHADGVVQKDLQCERNQLLYESKILRFHDCFSESDGSRSKLAKSHESQLKERASLVDDESRRGTSPIKSPVRATSLNLKANVKQGRKGLYQITVNPLETIENNRKVNQVLDSSDVILVGSSSAISIRNTAVTVLGKSQSEQKTSVSVLNTVQQPSVELRSSTLTIVEPLRKSKLKGLSTEEDLDFEDVSHLRTNSQFDVLNQVPVSHVHSDQKVTDSRAVSGKDFELCRTASGSVPVPSDSHTVEGGQSSLPSPFTCPNNELPAFGQASTGLSDDQIRVWVAELVLALESLHQQGIVCQDLNPRNVLLDSSGHVCLTYFGQWSEVEVQCSSKAVEDMYCAPEVGGILEVTEVCDWWSLGALLFELLTGMTLAQCYPSRIQPHTQLRLPDHLSPAAASLVRQLLKWDCRWRLGSGENGVQEIKSHPFFSSVQWTKLNG